jgi:hypothetical protein
MSTPPNGNIIYRHKIQIQNDRKVTQPIRDTFLFVKKYITLKSENKKQCYIKCWKCPPRSAMHTFTLFLMFDATRWRRFCVTETVHQTRYCRFVWHRRIGKCIPKLILASQVKTRFQVVFDNEHSLHLWKRHSCISTVERHLTNWHTQVTTWRDLRGLLYNHNDIVCLLIQSNCTELQPSIHIFNMGCVTFWSPCIFVAYMAPTDMYYESKQRDVYQRKFVFLVTKHKIIEPVTLLLLVHFPAINFSTAILNIPPSIHAHCGWATNMWRTRINAAVFIHSLLFSAEYKADIIIDKKNGKMHPWDDKGALKLKLWSNWLLWWSVALQPRPGPGLPLRVSL